MAQISRPFQIVLAAFALFALAWFAVLHRPGGESSTGGSSPSAASSAGAPAHVTTHAGASAVAHTAGHAAKRAHVATHIEAATTARHGAATPAKTQTRAHAKPATPAKTMPHATAAAHKGSTTAPKAATKTGHARHGAAPAAASASGTATATLHNLTASFHLNAVVKLLDTLDPALNVKGKVAHAENVLIARMKADLQPVSQTTIAAELRHGKTVMVLFLNPHSYDDDASAIAAVEVAYKLRHGVVAHLALANQVNSFGSITRDIQVYQTPTLLIVNPKRQVTTLTGLTDEFSLEQAIAEAKK